MIDIDELERLARAATPGPWIAVEGSTFQASTVITTEGRMDNNFVPICETETEYDVPFGAEQEANAAYIAAANPAAVLELIEDKRASDLRAMSNAEMFKAVQTENASLREQLAKSEQDAARRDTELRGWIDLFCRVAKELNCLPSSFIDGNEHVIRAAIDAQRGKQ